MAHNYTSHPIWLSAEDRFKPPLCQPHLLRSPLQEMWPFSSSYVTIVETKRAKRTEALSHGGLSTIGSVDDSFSAVTGKSDLLWFTLASTDRLLGISYRDRSPYREGRMDRFTSCGGLHCPSNICTGGHQLPNGGYVSRAFFPLGSIVQ